MKVLRINQSETYEWLLRVHYARRIPPITHAFGLYDGGELVGVVTYGVPASAPLRSGVAGKENAHLVVELNRLVFARQIKNGPSTLVGRSLRLLPRPCIVVSFADTEQGHVGYVYQATNFIYTGLSAKRTDWKIAGLEGLHGQTIADMSKCATGGDRGSRALFMREKFGDAFYLEDRSRKHRYIFICADGKKRAELMAAIKYPQQPYPKGETKKYEISHVPRTQWLLSL